VAGRPPAGALRPRLPRGTARRPHHGGFYKHFDSRGDLVAESVDPVVAQSVEASQEVIADADDPWPPSSTGASRPPGRRPRRGCSLVALGADDRVRTAYRSQVVSYITDLEALLGRGEDARPRVAGQFEFAGPWPRNPH
jgi:hypothetical protein